MRGEGGGGSVARFLSCIECQSDLAGSLAVAWLLWEAQAETCQVPRPSWEPGLGSVRERGHSGLVLTLSGSKLRESGPNPAPLGC